MDALRQLIENPYPGQYDFNMSPMGSHALTSPSLVTRHLGLLGGALLLLTLGGLAAHGVGSLDPESETRKAIFVGLGLLAACAYFAAVALVLRRRVARQAVWIVLGVAALLRLAVLTMPPFLSTDLYRYVWDGRVQANGINPYLYVPNDPKLTALRDDLVYPRITRADYARTIYPPMAQALFLGIAKISQTPLAVRMAMIAFETIAMLVMLRLLRLAGQEGARVAIYAWNPVTVWEFAGNGHIDAASIGLIALAVLASVRCRPGLVGIALGGAALVKFLPLSLFPVLWRRFDLRMPVATVATILVLYACYSSAGWAVVGFLPGYAAEEHLDAGNGIYWLDAIQHVLSLPAYAGRLWLTAAALILVILSYWTAFQRPRRPAVGDDIVWIASGFAIIATAVMLAVTPHYTWYFAWLAWPCCLAPYASVIWLSVAPIMMYHDPFHDHALQFSFIYLPFLVLAVRDILLSVAGHK